MERMMKGGMVLMLRVMMMKRTQIREMKLMRQVKSMSMRLRVEKKRRRRRREGSKIPGHRKSRRKIHSIIHQSKLDITGCEPLNDEVVGQLYSKCWVSKIVDLASWRYSLM